MQQAITEQTAQLRVSEARYRGWIELAADWYWEQDENGQFTSVHGPILEMLGISLDGAVPTDDAGGWNSLEQHMLRATIQARQPFLDFILTRHLLDGSVHYYRISGEPLFDKSCRFAGYRGLGARCLNKN